MIQRVKADQSAVKVSHHYGVCVYFHNINKPNRMQLHRRIFFRRKQIRLQKKSLKLFFVATKFFFEENELKKIVLRHK